MSAKDFSTVQNPPQPGTGAAAGDLKLTSVGKAKLVVTYHRNAYGTPAMGLQARAA